MQNNEQNNWKELLENTGAFPGEIIPGKNEVWEKLYTRLHKKPSRKFPVWYWAAAAFMVVTTTAIIFLTKESDKTSLPVTLSSPANNQQSTITNDVFATGAQDKNDAVTRTQEKKNTLIISHQKNTTGKKVEVLNNQLTADSPKELAIEPVHQPVSQFDSSTQLATETSVKKKLKVVHVNDLGQPMEESTADNKFAEGHRFQLKIINSENYNPASTTPTDNGIILFKSKNVSN